MLDQYRRDKVVNQRITMKIDYAKQALPQILEDIRRILYHKYGECRCPLHYHTPFQLLVATVLSAQCTDQRVNTVTEKLFNQFPNAAMLAKAPQSVVEKILYPLGLFRAKAINIIGVAKMTIEQYRGKIPANMEKLTKLPGVGRKTANVILGNAFGIPGFPVDTHVKRVLNRIGVVESNSPEAIETEVNQMVPEKYWTNLSHLLILHGRQTCRARNPQCERCELNHLCAFSAEKYPLPGSVRNSVRHNPALQDCSQRSKCAAMTFPEG